MTNNHKVLLGVAVCCWFVTPAVAEQATNPPPANRLCAYAGYDFRPMVLGSQIDGKTNAEKVLAKLEENVVKNVAPVVADWKSRADATAPNRLVFEPTVLDLHKPSGATRFFAGAMAGSGKVLVEVKITEQPSGKVVATPQFYQRANAFGGAWTVGGTDNAMLGRVTELIADYMKGNCENAVGGRTGYD